MTNKMILDLAKRVELLSKVSRKYGNSLIAMIRFGYPDPLLTTVKSIVKLLSHLDTHYEYIGGTPQLARMEQYQKWIDDYDNIISDTIAVEDNQWSIAYRNADTLLQQGLPILDQHGLPEVLVTEIYKNKRCDISNRITCIVDDLNMVADDMKLIIENPNDTEKWASAFRKAIADQPKKFIDVVEDAFISHIVVARPNHEPVKLAVDIPETTTDAIIEFALQQAVIAFELNLKNLNNQ